jgi:putative NADH-flavin reductase
MSKIAIIGATGRAGSQLLEEALRRGHSVTAIARDTSKIGQRTGVVSKNVDALDSAALQAAVAGHDVVISAAHFATLPASAVIGPVKKAGVNRLLVVGGAGSLLLPDGTRVIDSPASRPSTRPKPARVPRSSMPASGTGTGLDLPVAIGRVCRRRTHRQIPHRQG